MAFSGNQHELVELIEDSKEALTCGFCTKIYVDPKKLDCTHSFCKCCLDSSLQFSDDGSCEITCPLCETKASLSDIQTTNDIYTSRHAAQLLKVYHGLIGHLEDTEQGNIAMSKCSGDKDCQEEVTLFCPDESRYFCGNHDNNKTSSCKSVRFDSNSNTLRSWCDPHSTFAEFICPDGELICLYCTQRDFKGHEYEYVKDKHEEITRWMGEQENKLPKVEKIYNDIEAYKAKLEQAPGKLKKYLELRTLRIISDTYNKLIKIENKMMKEFKADIDKHINNITTQEIPVSLFDTEKPVIQVIFEKENITKIAESLKIPSPVEISLTNPSGYNTIAVTVICKEGPVKSILDTSLEDIPEEMDINYNLLEIPPPSEDDIRNLESFIMQVSWRSTSVTSENGNENDKESVGAEDVTSDEICQQIRDCVANKIVGDWKRLGRILKISENKIEQIELDNQKVYEKASQCMNSWVQSAGQHAANWEDLKKALTEMERNDIIEEVENRYFQKGDGSSTGSGSFAYDTQSIIGSPLTDEEISTSEANYKSRGMLYIVSLLKDEEIHILQHLISKYPDILKMKDNTTNESLIHIASEIDSVPAMELLKSFGMLLNMKDQANETVLHKAAYINTTEVFKFILGSDKSFINDRNTSGRTALHVAAGRGNGDCVEILLKYGCDREVKDVSGLTAADVAMTKCDQILFKRNRKKSFKNIALRIKKT